MGGGGEYGILREISPGRVLFAVFSPPPYRFHCGKAGRHPLSIACAAAKNAAPVYRAAFWYTLSVQSIRSMVFRSKGVA